MKPGFRDTDLGRLPTDWRVDTLGSLNPYVTSGSRGWARYYADRGSAFVRITNLSRGSIHLDLSDLKLVDLPPQDREGLRTQLRSGDLLVSITADIGIIGYVDEHVPQPAYINQHIALVRCNPSTADTKYLAYYLASGQPQRAFRARTDQGAKAGMNLAGVLGIRAALPDVPEQRAIATALSDVDALLDSQDRLIAKKRDLMHATLQPLLAGVTRLPGFSGDWECMRVQDVITDYFCGPSPTCEERNVQDEVEWGVLKTTAITKENGWDWKMHKTLPHIFWNRPHLELRVGDVVVTKAGPRHRVGVAAWVDHIPPQIIVSGKMIGLRPRPDKVVPLMLAAAISAREAQVFLDQRTTGMAESQVNFENSALLETPIRLPPTDEQRSIAAVAVDMEAELSALERERAKSRDLKQAMMQELLTGRTRLVPVKADDA